MIRFLQKDTKIAKAIYVVIIGAASVGMVVYLIPGLMSGSAAAPDTYAEVYPHWYSKLLPLRATWSACRRSSRLARQEISQRNPQYLDNPVILNFSPSRWASSWCSSRYCSLRPPARHHRQQRRRDQVPPHRPNRRSPLPQRQVHWRRGLHQPRQRAPEHVRSRFRGERPPANRHRAAAGSTSPPASP